MWPCWLLPFDFFFFVFFTLSPIYSLTFPTYLLTSRIFSCSNNIGEAKVSFFSHPWKAGNATHLLLCLMAPSLPWGSGQYETCVGVRHESLDRRISTFLTLWFRIVPLPSFPALTFYMVDLGKSLSFFPLVFIFCPSHAFAFFPFIKHPRSACLMARHVAWEWGYWRHNCVISQAHDEALGPVPCEQAWACIEKMNACYSSQIANENK